MVAAVTWSSFGMIEYLRDGPNGPSDGLSEAHLAAQLRAQGAAAVQKGGGVE